MKRTAKWQKHLTIKQLKHLAENGSVTIKSVKANITHQMKLKAQGNPFPCHECTAINNRLDDAGVISLKEIRDDFLAASIAIGTKILVTTKSPHKNSVGESVVETMQHVGEVRDFRGGLVRWASVDTISVEGAPDFAPNGTVFGGWLKISEVVLQGATA